MHEDYSLNVETFDPNEKITFAEGLPYPKRPHISETINALGKALSPSATVGFTMREAEAVGLVFQRGTLRERLARRALRMIGFLRRFRTHPLRAFTGMFKDKGRPEVTTACRNVAASVIGVEDQQVSEALRRPIQDMDASHGTSTSVFNAYRQLITP